MDERIIKKKKKKERQCTCRVDRGPVKEMLFNLKKLISTGSLFTHVSKTKKCDLSLFLYPQIKGMVMIKNRFLALGYMPAFGNVFQADSKTDSDGVPVVL